MEGSQGRGIPGGSLAFGLSGFLLFFILSLSVVIFSNLHLFSSPLRQPIQFNHRKHVEEYEMDCDTCHEFFQQESFSGLPTADLCSTCHLEPLGESEEEKKLSRYLEKGVPLDWKPLFRQPPYVFYSHRTHVAVAEIECATCHGAIADTESPPGRVKKLRMNDCLDCHRREKASTECTACHR